MCPCVSMYVSKALWSCVSHPNTTRRIPDIPVGRNYSILGMLTSLLLAYGGQMIETNRGETEPEPSCVRGDPRRERSCRARSAGGDPTERTWQRSWVGRKGTLGCKVMRHRS